MWRIFRFEADNQCMCSCIVYVYICVVVIGVVVIGSHYRIYFAINLDPCAYMCIYRLLYNIYHYALYTHIHILSYITLYIYIYIQGIEVVVTSADPNKTAIEIGKRIKNRYVSCYICIYIHVNVCI